MSHDPRQHEVLEAKTERLMQGPLKHARKAILAAALVPLASLAATPAQAQETCASGGICGYVWNDTNNNGVQDAGETGISGAVVTLDGTVVTYTDANGFYFFEGPFTDGDHEVAVQIPPGTQASPPNAGDDSVDSDGVPDSFGNSIGTVTVSAGSASGTDFGFFTPPVTQPGTGTPGYWKNHPEAWPVESITIGGVTYTKDEAISWLGESGKDKTVTMFSSLLSAELNVLIGNDSSCVETTIVAADAWMAEYGPVGSGVHAASFAWKVGEPLHRQMDNYNNGMLCAPHRD